MLLQLAKAWRVLLPEGDLAGQRDPYLHGVAWLFLSLAFFAHVMASVLLVLGSQEAAAGGPSWTDDLLEAGPSCQELYTEASYFAVLSLTSVGYGDRLITPLEHGANSLFLLLSQLFTAKICADFTWLTSTHNHWEAHHHARQAQTWVAMQHMQVPQTLTDRVLAYQGYIANVHREDLTQPAFVGLSENLMKELRLCAYRSLVLKAPFLREQPKEVIAMIVGALRDAVFLPADFIVRVGDRGRELFFVRRGEAAVYTGPEAPHWGDQALTHYVAGHYFGEVAMLTGRPRAAWIMAKTYCVCSVLPYSAVENLGQEHPGAFTILVQSMVREYDLTSSLEWVEISTRLVNKFNFTDVDDAFAWFCNQGDVFDEDELSAKAFDMGMRRLRVPELDRKILWADMDADNSGFVTIDEFSHRVAVGAEVRHLPRKLARRDSVCSATSDASPSADLSKIFNSERSVHAERTAERPAHMWAPDPQRRNLLPTDMFVELRKELAEGREQTRRLIEEVAILRSLHSPAEVVRVPGTVVESFASEGAGTTVAMDSCRTTVCDF